MKTLNSLLLLLNSDQVESLYFALEDMKCKGSEIADIHIDEWLEIINTESE